MRFIPLASDISIGAIAPRNRDGINEDTNEIREVALRVSGSTRLIWKSYCHRFWVRREILESTYLANLTACESLVSTTAGEIRKNLRSADRIL